MVIFCLILADEKMRYKCEILLSEKLGYQMIPKQTPSAGKNGKTVFIIISLNLSPNLYLLFMKLL